MKKEIRIGTYPYAATRVKVMKTALIKKEEYSKLMKMRLPEINQFLQENGYKEQINALATKYDGVELIEQAVVMNSVSTYRKVKMLSSRGLAEIVGIFLKRFDASNIKNIVRGKFSGASYDEIMASLIPAGDLDAGFLADVAKKNTIREVIFALNTSQALKETAAEFERTQDISSIENAVDLQYYEEIYSAADALPKQGRLLKELLRTEIDSGNIRMLLRAKKSGIDSKEIKKHISPNGLRLSKKMLHELAEAKDVDELVEKLQKTEYGRIIAKGLERFRAEKTLAMIETELTKNLLRRGALFMHQNPLSIGPVMGFSIAKEAEVRNLKMIAHARHRGLPESFMEEMLVV